MKRIALKSILIALVLSLSAAAFPFFARADQPRMQAAKADLENALKFLNRATADKGGHRAKAMDLTSKAIKAVNDGIEYDRTHYTPRGRNNSSGDFDGSNVQPSVRLGDQPNMETARKYLEDAMRNLARASTDKGGYREQAMGFVRDAVAEVNAGIEYDRNN